MSKFSRFLVITSLVAALSGCLGSSMPDTAQSSQALRTVDAEDLPADIMSCDDFYGEDWDTPDMILIVIGSTGTVVLIQADEMVCTGQLQQIEVRLRGVDVDSLMPLDDENELPAEEGKDGFGGGRVESPVADSNPLPASPFGDTAEEESPMGDSNPLPAMPADDDSGTVEDSNPLPAYDDPNVPGHDITAPSNS